MSAPPGPDNVLAFPTRWEAEAHDAERKLLGALLRDSSLLSQVPDLKPEDFGDERHRTIFEAILAVAERRRAQS